MSPFLADAEAGFRRDLDDLLAHHDREWVAYHGPRQLVVMPSKSEVRVWCEQQGFAPQDIIIRCVLPEFPDLIDLTETLDR